MFLVTGGTGFLGSYVVRDLLARGERVCALDYRPDPRTLALIAGEEALQYCPVKRVDVSMAAQIIAAVQAARPRVILHLASPLPPETEHDPSASIKQMTQSHLNVLEAARICEVEKVVWTSATSVFGPPECHGGIETVVDDDAPHYPVTLYGIYKSANERLSRFYWQRYGLESLGLRFCQGYGPGKSRGRPFGYRLFEDALEGRRCVLPFGDDVINWQYSDEMSEILVRAALAPSGPARVLNTSGEVISTLETAEILRHLRPGLQVELEPGTAGLVWRYASDRLEAELGFRSTVGVEEGFRRTFATLDAWRRHGS